MAFDTDTGKSLVVGEGPVIRPVTRVGYGFLYILANRSAIVQWSALAVILVGYWAAFALYPVPERDFKWDAAGVKENDAETHLSGFAEHWSKNTNAAWAFDKWFLNK